LRLAARSLLLLALAGCGGAATTSTETEPTTPPPPSTLQPCALAGGTLRVPVAEGWALAASPEGCLLVDEAHEGSALSIGALPQEHEASAMLEADVRGFFRDSGILGAHVRFVGRESVDLLGAPTEAHDFLAELEGLGPRGGLALARAVGPTWIVVMLFHAPGDEETRAALVRALEAVEPAPSE
jgi:hypothetical protein